MTDLPVNYIWEMCPVDRSVMLCAICVCNYLMKARETELLKYEKHRYFDKNDFEVILRSLNDCEAPQPPFPKRRIIEPLFEVFVSNGRSYIRGNSSIRAAVPFRNFSAHTFQVIGNRREVKFQVLRVSCRNFIAAAILKFSNISYSKDSCALFKGFYTYIVDVDKFIHSIPSWHMAGSMVHQLQMVSGGFTALCTEFHVDVVGGRNT